MNSKSIIAFVSIFLIQFVMSCNPCKCDDAITYEVEYDGITITPWNTSGFGATEVIDTVYRNSFGITLSVNFEPRKVSRIPKNFGFSAALACDCIGDEYNFIDPIDNAEIYVTDVSTDEQQDITELFGAYGFSGELISLSELFSIQEEWHDGFQFELIDFDSIPSTAFFTVIVYLESGIRLSEQTQQINFHD
ncbi:MAG: hypothetical protein GY816_20465 [Cytophagales bacterium]|nr:hypothetical protein [Cytophagales bacterium]